MALFNRDGRAEFYSRKEVKNIMIDYLEFNVRRQAFKTDPEIQAPILLEKIETMRRIASELRYSLPDYMGLRDRQLNELEQECRKYAREKTPAATR